MRYYGHELRLDNLYYNRNNDQENKNISINKL